MKKILCDLCKRDIKEEKDIWYIQTPFYQKDGVYVNGKLIGEFGSYWCVLEKEKLQVDSFGVMKGRSIYNVWIY